METEGNMLARTKRRRKLKSFTGKYWYSPVGRYIGKVLALTGAGAEKTPVFILGCQRSGTGMLCNVLDRSQQIRVFDERSQKAFVTEGRRIHSIDNLRSLICLNGEPVVVFKPLNDTQRADELLGMHANAKAAWMYRDFSDVVNSLVTKWNDTNRVLLDEISTGEYSGPGSEALGERMSPEDLATVRRFCSPTLSVQDSAALIWYIRNVIYFDLKLETNPNVLLCRYEDLVSNALPSFSRIFEFIGCDMSPTYVANVSASSVGKGERPTLSPEIEELCAGLLARMDHQYRTQQPPGKTSE